MKKNILKIFLMVCALCALPSCSSDSEYGKEIAHVQIGYNEVYETFEEQATIYEYYCDTSEKYIYIDHLYTDKEVRLYSSSDSEYEVFGPTVLIGNVTCGRKVYYDSSTKTITSVNSITKSNIRADNTYNNDEALEYCFTETTFISCFASGSRGGKKHISFYLEGAVNPSEIKQVNLENNVIMLRTSKNSFKGFKECSSVNFGGHVFYPTTTTYGLYRDVNIDDAYVLLDDATYIDNGYYTRQCSVTLSEKFFCNMDERLLRVDFTLTSDDPTTFYQCSQKPIYKEIGLDIFYAQVNSSCDTIFAIGSNLIFEAN